MSETVVKPGEFAKPNPEALALVDGTAASGGGIIPRAEFNGDGGYTPPEAKIYFETMDIAYGVGFGAQIGAPAGSFCFNKKDIIVSGQKKPLTCIIAGAVPYWREWKAYDPEANARTWPTREAAVAAGMDPVGSPYGSGGPKANVGPAVQLALFVQEPEGGTASTSFTLLLGGKRYAPARFRIAGTAYRCVEKMLSGLPSMDAAQRGVPPAQGKLGAFVVQFSTEITIEKGGKTKTRLNLAAVPGPDGRAQRVPQAFWDDLAEYNRQLRAVCGAGAVTSDGDGDGDGGAGAEPPVAIEM